MLVFFGALIILACVLLGLFVLVQNPKGGGLSGTFGGFGNQVMGVRQTTDVLEKGTWVLATIIGALCLASTFFIPSDRVRTAPASRSTQQQTAPANNTPASQTNFPTTSQPITPNKKP